MKIMIMRHAQALSRDESEVPYDAERPLSPTGLEQARQVGRLLNQLELVPDPVVSSPFTRTLETASVICQAFDNGQKPQPLSILAPGSGPDELLRAAVNYRQDPDGWILAVMHEPDVGFVLGLLLAGGKAFPCAVRPGDIYAVNVQPRHGQTGAELVFSFSPGHFLAERGAPAQEAEL